MVTVLANGGSKPEATSGVFAGKAQVNRVTSHSFQNMQTGE